MVGLHVRTLAAAWNARRAAIVEAGTPLLPGETATANNTFVDAVRAALAGEETWPAVTVHKRGAHASTSRFLVCDIAAALVVAENMAVKPHLEAAARGWPTVLCRTFAAAGLPGGVAPDDATVPMELHVPTTPAGDTTAHVLHLRCIPSATAPRRCPPTPGAATRTPPPCPRPTSCL